MLDYKLAPGHKQHTFSIATSPALGGKYVFIRFHDFADEKTARRAGADLRLSVMKWYVDTINKVGMRPVHVTPESAKSLPAIPDEFVQTAEPTPDGDAWGVTINVGPFREDQVRLAVGIMVEYGTVILGGAPGFVGRTKLH